MSDTIYKKLKKQNGEKFAQDIRNFHNGILEIPDLDVIVRHAGREAALLLPYLMSLLAANQDTPDVAPEPGDPFDLLDKAGYDAFYADTLEKQNSIKPYFKKGELLCTFNDRARYKNYHIVHAVKKDADKIKREDFEGKEEREDKYGTSVISIQILKEGGFISIKNRYNHTVSGCDHTFGSNPDNIIPGLSGALKEHFNVDFSTNGSSLPYGFVEIGNQLFKYYYEINNIYYGDQAWVENGMIHTVDRGKGNALFGKFLFEHKTKTLKKIDEYFNDSFAEDFNRCYGGNKDLNVDKSGNLTLNGKILIGAEQSRIKTLDLPELTTMGKRCLCDSRDLTHLNVPNLKSMGSGCFINVNGLTNLDLPNLVTMGDDCFFAVNGLTHLNVPNLKSMGSNCLNITTHITNLDLPNLVTMGDRCFFHADNLTHLNVPKLISMGDKCFLNMQILTHLDTPNLVTMGQECFDNADSLLQYSATVLTKMGERCFKRTPDLTQVNAPNLVTMGRECFYTAKDLTPRNFNAPVLRTVEEDCFKLNPVLKFHLRKKMPPQATLHDNLRNRSISRAI